MLNLLPPIYADFCTFGWSNNTLLGINMVIQKHAGFYFTIWWYLFHTDITNTVTSAIHEGRAKLFVC